MFSRTWAGRALRWPSSQLTTPTPTTTATTHPPIATLGPSAPAARRPAAMTRRRVAQTKWLDSLISSLRKSATGFLGVFLFICPPVRQASFPSIRRISLVTRLVLSLLLPQQQSRQGSRTAAPVLGFPTFITRMNSLSPASSTRSTVTLARSSSNHRLQHYAAPGLRRSVMRLTPALFERAFPSDLSYRLLRMDACNKQTRRSLGNDLFAVGHRLLRLRPAPADPMKTLSSRRSEICSTLQHERDGS
ncbi:hypothetical protein V8E36_006064 [Tilletia maclaganii]